MSAAGAPTPRAPAPAGYSGTPLPRKLGIRPSHRVGLVRPPNGFLDTLGALPEGAAVGPLRRGAAYDVVLLFARDVRALETRLAEVERDMTHATRLWICWPKKTSPLASDLDGNGVRARGLAAGLVDVKVCAVDADWSGLQFVYRLKDRKSRPVKTK